MSWRLMRKCQKACSLLPTGTLTHSVQVAALCVSTNSHKHDRRTQSCPYSSSFHWDCVSMHECKCPTYTQKQSLSFPEYRLTFYVQTSVWGLMQLHFSPSYFFNPPLPLLFLPTSLCFLCTQQLMRGKSPRADSAGKCKNPYTVIFLG